MRPTRVTTLLFVAVVAGLATYLLVSQYYSDLPPLPRTAALSTIVLAGAEAFVAPSIRNRLAGKPRTKPIMPIVVARTAALAKASSALAAALAGIWAGFGGYVLPRDAPTPRRDLRTAILGFGAALLLAAAALWLENVCRVKQPPPSEPPPAEPGP